MKYLQPTPSESLPDIQGLRPYKAVIIIETRSTAAEQTRISQWLIESGCLYMMAWGKDCASWAESVQLANRAAFDTAEIPDQSLAITTWHDNQTLNDVFWFSKYTAMHPCFKLDNVLLLHLSEINREREISAAYASA